MGKGKQFFGFIDFVRMFRKLLEIPLQLFSETKIASTDSYASIERFHGGGQAVKASYILEAENKRH